VPPERRAWLREQKRENLALTSSDPSSRSPSPKAASATYCERREWPSLEDNTTAPRRSAPCP
jgi:hypothetical protein